LLHISQDKTLIDNGDLEQKKHKLRLQFEGFLLIMKGLIFAKLGMI
tara:strand:- start:15 stop:152 length:138 start_codon:yes stop_codon:yes gene_type:complete